MQQAVLIFEPRDANYRNGAHRGPVSAGRGPVPHRHAGAGSEMRTPVLLSDQQYIRQLHPDPHPCMRRRPAGTGRSLGFPVRARKHPFRAVSFTGRFPARPRSSP